MDTTKTKLISFNCKGVKRSLPNVQELSKENDIIALQELWLLPDDLDFLSQISLDFGYHGISAVDTSAGPLKGRPYGGVAVLWRKSLFTKVSIVETGSKRIAAVRAELPGNRSIIVMSVYMPTDCTDNLPLFTECLGVISAITEDSDSECMLALGDFNADIRASFGKELMTYCEDQKWVCADVELLGELRETFTFKSDVQGSKSWLDHCVATESAHKLCTNARVLYDVYWSDHYPLQIECDMSLIEIKSIPCPIVINKVLWGNRCSEQIKRYHLLCSKYLSAINVCIDNCGKTCNNSTHLSLISKFYNDIIKSIQTAAKLTSASKMYNNKVTGWNYHVLPLYNNAREAPKAWLLHGSPTSGPVYDEMTIKRKSFKNKLCWCQRNQEKIKMDIIASHRSTGNFSQFWKETNKLSYKQTRPMSVNGLHKEKDIANMFSKQFKVDNSPQNSQSAYPPDSVRDRGDPTTGPELFITQDMIWHCVRNMKRGKSPGHDGLSIEHILYGGPLLHVKMAQFFNLCLAHGFLPDEFMTTNVVPIVKNRTGDLSDPSNYRPISLATVLSKVLEKLISPILTEHIQLNDAQFGFRPGLSTDMAIFCLKNTVSRYLKKKTSVYACFLDLSRAFDTIDYSLLWEKVSKAGVPRRVAGLLGFWYGNQTNSVKWGSSNSDPYKLNCGVRQGGLTSPLLFNLYMNELIEELSRAAVGCHVAGVCANNLSYADDMVLLSPSITGLRMLISICERYAALHGLKYNVKKSEIMIFKYGRGPEVVPPVRLNGTELKNVNSFRYLGHILTDKLKDDDDLERQRRAIAMRSNMLARRFAHCSDQVKITLFGAYCQAFYTSHLWCHYTKRSFNRLRVQYNNAFRVMLRLPWRCSASGMFAVNRVDDFYAIMRKRHWSFVRRVSESTNSIVKIVFTSCYLTITSKVPTTPFLFCE
jgi:exonuclease III